jgi:hypothetical protein
MKSKICVLVILLAAAVSSYAFVVGHFSFLIRSGRFIERLCASSAPPRLGGFLKRNDANRH